MNTFKNIFKSKITIAIAVILVVIIGAYFLFFKHATTYHFVTVQKSSITETVSVTGNTAPIQSVSLSFGSSGIISNVYTDLGKQVNAGQILAQLNTNDLLAQLHQAQADVSTQQAKLAGLQAGSRPQDIALAQVTLDNAKTDLENTKEQQAVLVTNANNALLNSTITAYTTIGGNTTAPAVPLISGTYTGTREGSYTIMVHTTGSGAYFSLSGLESGSGQVSTVPVPMGTLGLYIQFPNANVSTYFNNTFTVPIPNTQASNYSANLNAYNSALTAENSIVAQKEAVVAEDQAQLDVQNAGSLPTDITAQEAQVAQAQASVESAQAQLQNAEIIAPISGTITQFDAKIGQQASPATPLVSIMSNGGYEVDAGVSETDVGKILVGDTVTMTLDAFPGQTFNGSVFYIAPAQTNTNGVITYQIKISFDTANPMLKSGLTANIDIQTNYKDNVLVLPQYAILQNDQGTFVETVENKTVKQNPVTLGIQDEKGNVEVVSGVTEGEQVLNIGLKS